MVAETLPLASTAIIQWEATSMTRVLVPATTGLKAGQLVNYPLRNQKLVALTDEYEGKVQVQPHNCVIHLDHTPTSEIENLETLKTQGDTYGIVYRGTPKS